MIFFTYRERKKDLIGTINYRDENLFTFGRKVKSGAAQAAAKDISSRI